METPVIKLEGRKNWNIWKKKLTLGKHPILDFDNEKRLVIHVQKLETAGFPVTRDMLRSLAFEFAEKLGISHKFDKETRKAGHHWLQSFLERHPELSVRQAEGLSLARAQGLNREEVNKMFELLLKVLTEHDLVDKPDRLFNIDETGVQLNNKPEKVIATKGAKSVHSITSGEKGETTSIIACCNAAGNFLSPVVIIKGVNQKPEFYDGLPPGSDVYMNKKSAYVNAEELFQKWLVQHFVPRKPQGKVLLLLDGHSSHTNSADMLETAKENGVILFCLPSHSTQALQPLDRSFFKPFKTFYAAETRNSMLTNKDKKISRSVAGKLIGNAWIRAATPSNAVSGFRGCGIYPCNPAAIPESFFAISDLSTRNQAYNEQENVLPNERDGLLVLGPSCSNESLRNLKDDEVLVSPTFSPSSPSLQPEIQKGTPSKYLQDYSPVPKIPIPLFKRGKQSAAVLASEENIAAKKNKGKATLNIPCKSSKLPRKLASKRPRADSEDVDASSTLNNPSKSIKLPRKLASKRPRADSEDKNECVECFEDYENTKSKVDWIQCIMCKKWLHETCTMYCDYCNQCHRLKLLNEKKNK